MIVEDEPNVRLVFRAALESETYTLTTAEDGETALRRLKLERSDLVLLDLRMPGIGGMEVIKEHPDSAEPWYLLGVLHEVQHKQGGCEGCVPCRAPDRPGL